MVTETEIKQLEDAYRRTAPEGRKRILRMVVEFADCFPDRATLQLVSSSRTPITSSTPTPKPLIYAVDALN